MITAILVYQHSTEIAKAAQISLETLASQGIPIIAVTVTDFPYHLPNTTIMRVEQPDVLNIARDGYFAYCVNKGVMAAQTERICLANADMRYSPNIISDVDNLLNRYRTISISKTENGGIPHECYWLSGFYKQDFLELNGCDERLLGCYCVDLDLYSRMVNFLGINNHFYAANLIMHHINHPRSHTYEQPEKLFPAIKFNSYLTKTNPFKVNLDYSIGTMPPKRLSNVYCSQFVYDNPFVSKLKSYPQPFDLQVSKEWEVPYLIEYTMPHHHKCLDVGCGLSPFPQWLAEYRQCEIVGIDSEVDSYHHLPKIDKSAVSYLKADARNIPFPDKYFDRVYCVSVLEHLAKDDCITAMKELARVCKGLIGISIDYRLTTESGAGFNATEIKKYLLEPIAEDFEPIYPLDLEVRNSELLWANHIASKGYSFAAVVLGNKHLS